MMTNEERQQIKAANNERIKAKGYRVNEWLPVLESPTPRSLEEIKGRMGVMNALINIAFRAPVHIIKEWIEAQQLTQYLSENEKALLESEDELADEDIAILGWYLESLWALMWLTEMDDNLEAEIHVPDHMASLLPNLQQNDNNERLNQLQHIRDEVTACHMLDYYYRLHWYCVDQRLNGRQVKLNEGLVYERRKALEWALNRSNDWDDVELGT